MTMVKFRKSNIDAARLSEYLNYDPESGNLRWLKRAALCVRVGDIAGCVLPSGYRVVRLFGQNYMAHRLAWLFMTREWPQLDIDHKNRQRDDNRWENLRLATGYQQQANRKGSSTLPKGVKQCPTSVRRYGNRPKRPYEAAISAKGVYKYLGKFETAEEAHAAYCREAQIMFGEFWSPG